MLREIRKDPRALFQTLQTSDGMFNVKNYDGAIGKAVEKEGLFGKVEGENLISLKRTC